MDIKFSSLKLSKQIKKLQKLLSFNIKRNLRATPEKLCKFDFEINL